LNQPADVVPLGTTDIRVTALGVGTWAWGDRLYWGYGRGYGDSDVREAFESSLASGVNFFDTAEVYGRGRSERLLGQFIRSAGEPVIVATKFLPYPWRLRRDMLIRALRQSLERLELPNVHLYQIHIPLPPLPVETWAEGLADAVKQGLARAVGVSNFDEEQMRRTYLSLAKHGIPLASNQVEYSLLNRRVEVNGLLQLCQELGITLIAYSPLAQGVLTGKYSPEKPPPGMRGRHYNRAILIQIQPLLRTMREIGMAHGGRTTSQVALNWLMCKGTIPIPGAKNARQAQDNAGALGWRLSDEEIMILDEASAKISAG
jgi:aryl-alcohol dehydrogenase-like predicted oxidoreductase